MIERGVPGNIIVIMTDQHRADLSAREGFPVDTTPTLDALAKTGSWFPHAYTSAPLCVPARVSLLTGRYPSAHGIRENFDYEAPSYVADLMDVAAAADYRTAMIGKNHSHLTAKRVDVFAEYGHLGRIPASKATGVDAEFDAWLRELGFDTALEPTPFPVEHQLPYRIVDDTIDFLASNPEGRNLVWLSIPEPHVPYQVPEPYFDQFPPDDVPPPETTRKDLPEAFSWRYAGALGEHSSEADGEVLRRARANYVAMLRLIDDQILRLLDHLEETGRLEDTLIVFVADHGDFVGEYGLMRKGPGVPEVLVRVPLVFAGVGIEGGLNNAHVSIVDLFPTLCHFMGQPIPAGTQGRSLIEVLRGADGRLREFESAYVEQGIGGIPSSEEDVAEERPGVVVAPSGKVTVDTLNAVTQGGLLRMVRAGRYKVVQDVLGEIQLFDLELDPYELNNCAGRPDLAAIEARMLKRLSAWLVRTADPLPIPPHGYPRKVHPMNYVWDDEAPW